MAKLNGGVASGLLSLNISGWDFADLNGDRKDDRKYIILLHSPSGTN